MDYRTRGVCAQVIHFELDGDIVKNVQFLGGCNGNLQGIAKLVEGMKAEDVITRLQGIRCGNKQTSCPDQFACALKHAISK